MNLKLLKNILQGYERKTQEDEHAVVQFYLLLKWKKLFVKHWHTQEMLFWGNCYYYYYNYGIIKEFTVLLKTLKKDILWDTTFMEKDLFKISPCIAINIAFRMFLIDVCQGRGMGFFNWMHVILNRLWVAFIGGHSIAWCIVVIFYLIDFIYK